MCSIGIEAGNLQPIYMYMYTDRVSNSSFDLHTKESQTENFVCFEFIVSEREY